MRPDESTRWLLVDFPIDVDGARRCFACGVRDANGEGGSPTYFQVHGANGAVHGNVFMTSTSSRPCP